MDSIPRRTGASAVRYCFADRSSRHAEGLQRSQRFDFDSATAHKLTGGGGGGDGVGLPEESSCPAAPHERRLFHQSCPAYCDAKKMDDSEYRVLNAD